MLLIPGLADSVQIYGNSGPYTSGSTVILNCLATGGNPAPLIQWSKDGEFVAAGETYTFTAEPEDNARPIRCNAINGAGTIWSEVALEIFCEFMVDRVLYGSFWRFLK